jgi:hypothetical protein
MLIALGGTPCVAIQPVCHSGRSASIGSGWETLQVVLSSGTRWLHAPRGELKRSLHCVRQRSTPLTDAGLLGGFWLILAALVSDAFHMGFGCCVLSVSLVATIYARRPPDDQYSYG